MRKLKRADAASYVQAYTQMQLHSFLPQARIDQFVRAVMNELERRRRQDEASLESVRSAYEAERDYELFKMVCAGEHDIEEIDDLQELLYELVILSIHRSIEVERKRVLVERLPSLDPEQLSNWRYVAKAVPWVSELCGSAAVDEFRLLSNCIKHSGRVSRALARHNSQWQEGASLAEFRKAYERLAPFVGAYWVDLVERAKAQQTGPVDDAPIPEEPPRVTWNEKLEENVEELVFSLRTSSCLRKARIKTIGDLIQKTEADLLEIAGFGRKSLREVKEELASLGLRLGVQVDRSVERAR
jgi:hypothetical protein